MHPLTFVKISLAICTLAAVSSCSSMKGSFDALWIPQGGGAATPPHQQAEIRDPHRGGPSTRQLDRPRISQERVAVPVEKLPSLRERDTSSIELMWKIPEKPVTSYRIIYGYSRDDLSRMMDVSTTSLEKFEDAVHGTVYRYFLKDVPADKPTFISIAAVDGGKVSAPSAPIEVRPGTTEIKTPRPNFSESDRT